MINPFYSNKLSLSYHTSLFFISEAVYLRFFGGMCECNIFNFVFKTHILTHGCTSSSLLFICMFYYVKHETM